MTPRRGPGRSSGWPLIVVSAALACGHTSWAAAHQRGIAVDSCDGCHGGGTIAPPDLSLTSEPASFSPGDLVTFALDVRRPSIQVAGAYVTSAGVGVLQPLSGEGLATNGQGLSHTAPKAAANGSVTFRFAWRAPATPGAVNIGVAAMAGNGNGASSGDAPGTASFQWVFGCSGRTFFLDLDRDGHGSKTLGTRLACADAPTPAGYATVDGDCNENDENAHPDAIEVCNKQDDDCDGQVDEGAPPVALWPDADGDGFYAHQTGTPKTGCGDVPGYAALGGDCDDLDSSVHPQASETCNNKDDDCDGQSDEQARPACGLGWCSRYSATCNPTDCTPGPPAAETCNSFDDDCDGVADNDACAPGLVCSNGECVSAGAAPGENQGDAGSAAAAGAAGNSARAAPPAAGCSTRRNDRSWATEPWLVAPLLGALGALARRRRMKK